MDSQCKLLENLIVLLLTFPLQLFAKFLQEAAKISLHYLQESDQSLLLRSLLTGLSDTFTKEDITDEANKFISKVIMRLFVDLCDLMSKEANTAMNLNVPVLEKMATCLSHCTPSEVTLHCELSSDMPVRFLNPIFT